MSVNIKCVRSDNKVFVIGTGSWRILSDGLTGVDYPNVSVFHDKNGVGDGALDSGKRVDDRDIQVKAKTTNPANNEAVRKIAIAFFNPKYSYKLYITYMGLTRWIEGEIQGFNCPSGNVFRPITMTIKFYCKDGFMKSVDDFGQNIASIKAAFAFPYIQTAKIPVVADVYNYHQSVTIANDGDTMSYPRVTINFTGSAKNPKIYKDSYYVRILGSFQEGDVLQMDFENCTITKNGTNWIQYIDRSSTFTEMGLAIGDSTIGFAADDGDANMAVYVYYNKLYLGV